MEPGEEIKTTKAPKGLVWHSYSTVNDAVCFSQQCSGKMKGSVICCIIRLQRGGKKNKQRLLSQRHRFVSAIVEKIIKGWRLDHKLGQFEQIAFMCYVSAEKRCGRPRELETKDRSM